MTINWQSGIPAYDQIVQGFIKLRALGAMAPDEKLPSVRVMANNLGVNPNTVQKAYLILEEKGIIYSVAGKGSFISGSDRGTKAVFEAAGASLEKAVKTTCFLDDMGDFTAFNEVYSEYFTGKPARSCVAVKTLPKNALVEVEVIAEKE